MESEDLDATDPPTSIDPYAVLEITPDANANDIKSAYKRLALKTHPDKAPVEKYKEAHIKFQELAFAYAILSDETRRKRYDRTGSTAETVEDDDDFDWGDFFRQQFKEHVTVDKIRDLKKEYQGSEEEKGDVLKAYNAGRGDLDRVFEEVMFSSALEDEDRFRGYIDEAIKAKEVVGHTAYTQEPVKKRQARQKTALKEQKEARKAAEKMGIDEEVFGNDTEGPRTKSNVGARKKNTQSSEAELAALIQQRHSNRADHADTFLDNLAAKYGNGSSSKRKRKPNDEPSEEAFAAMAARAKKEKTPAEDDDTPKSSRPKRNKRKA